MCVILSVVADFTRRVESNGFVGKEGEEVMGKGNNDVEKFRDDVAFAR